MSIKVITQRNPFKQERTITDYSPSTILDIYALEQVGTPIEDCVVVLNDVLIDDYSVIPREGDLLIIKVVPAGEKFVANAAGVAGGIIAVGLIASIFSIAAIPLSVMVLAGVAGWAIGGAIYDVIHGLEPDKIDKNYTLSGDTNENNQYGIVPVIYGSTKYAPTYGGSDYTEYIDPDSIGVENEYVVLAAGFSTHNIYVNGVLYTANGGEALVQHVHAPLTIRSADSSTSKQYAIVTQSVYDTTVSKWAGYDPFVFGDKLVELPATVTPKQILIGSTDVYQAEDLSAKTTVGSKDIYLHQLYVLGYQPTVVESVYLEDAPLLDRNRTTITATMTGSTVTSVGAFTDYEVGMRILLENCVNAGEYIIEQVTDDVLTLDATLVDETVTCVISYLYASGTFTNYSIAFTTTANMPAIYPHQTIEASVNYTCNSGIYQYYTTPSNVTEATLNFGFLQGLNETASNGNLKNRTVACQVEYKAVADTAWTVLDTFTSVGSTTKAYYVNRAYVLGDRNTYNIRVKRVTADTDASNIKDVLTWVSTKTHAIDEQGNRVAPIETTTAEQLVCMALKIKATDQISGKVPTVRVVANRWIKDYDSIADAWVEQETHNPASAFVDVLTNDKLAYHPIPFTDEYFDMESIQAWHEWCDATSYTHNGITYEKPVYTCDGILSSETTVDTELLKICATGRAQYSVVDGRYTIIIEKPRDVVQMFTSRNIIKDSFSVTRSFDDVPDGVTVGFVNKDIGYVMDEFNVVDEYTTTSSYTFSYVDNYNQAYDLGRFGLNSFQYQILGYGFQASIDALVATRGDRIAVQHDAGLAAISSGRIQALTVNGGLLEALILDEPITMEEGKEYGIMVRAPETFETYKIQTVAGTQYVALLDESVALYDIEAGDLFSFGLHTQEVIDCVITDIGYSSDMNASITAIPYSDEMYDTGEIPVFTSNITKVGSTTTKPSISVYNDLDSALQQLATNQSNTASVRVFQSQPTAPYSQGDLWVSGVYLYDCVVANAVSFTQSDWRLRSSSAFDVLNKDTFNQATPEHRWQQIPGNGVDYNLLVANPYTVSSGDATKTNILIQDDTDWVSLAKKSAVTVDAEELNYVTADSNATNANAVGRYGASGYMGETYTNLLVDPDAPATQDVVVEAGNVVVQCYSGSITCSYGTATYNNPLVFTSEGETLALTMTDCLYGQVTQTDFVPPYVDGVFPNTSTSVGSCNTLTLVVEIANIPADTTYYIAHAYGDIDNSIDVYMNNGVLYVRVEVDDKTYITSYPAEIGTHTIEIDWYNLTITIDDTDYICTEVGDVYGYDDVVYGYDGNTYGLHTVVPTMLTPMATAYIGNKGSSYFNNVVLEVTC